MSLHILGIRHHGPGSSHHVNEALKALQPDIILIEGPPEGETILKWVSHPDMQAPVAMLAYVPEQPQQAVFYPFADYSPEWNAIRFAQQKNIPVRLIDMPLAHQLAKAKDAEISDEEHAMPDQEMVTEIKRNPLAYLADIAGYDDAEEWWEQQFEMAKHPAGVFEAIAHSMKALREQLPASADQREEIREAFMRKAIRTAQREMYSTIVVICGAWHVPALLNMPAQKQDDALLKNLPKTKIETTWIPWTNSRLSYESGYGAGITSPGWYQHCWHTADHQGIEWMTHTARVFRNHKIDISAAHIIEAVRLANSLAQIRNYARPGLREFNEAAQTVMCMGDELLMRIVWKDLIVGDNMGKIPEGTPQVPVMNDFEKQIKTYRLKLTEDYKTITLDLRENNDLQKSILLHRLNTMDIPWGELKTVRGKGTFKEEWQLCWTPALHLSLIEKAPWGNTIEMACNQWVAHHAVNSQHLADITALLQKAIPAELQEGIYALMKKMDALAASSNDTIELIDAIIPLAQISRYGNVRKTDLDTIEFILSAIFYRMIVGLPLSTTGIDEEQAQMLTGKINDLQTAILLLNNEEYKSAWLETIFKIALHAHAAAMVKGYAYKILYDTNYIETEQIALAFSKALSVNQDPNDAVNWLEGFLKDAGHLLILDDAIWSIVYEWIAQLEAGAFQELLPLLRRTFATFKSVEKIKLAEKVKHGKSHALKTAPAAEIDLQRAAKVIPIIEKLLHL